MLDEHEILNCLPCGVVITDREGRILVWNRAMSSLSGLSAEEMEGTPLQQWLPDIDRSHASIVLPHRDQWLDVRVHGQDFSGGCAWTFVQEVRQELDQAQADFVSTVSHELRTPLTSIKGFIDTLLRSGNQLSEKQQHRFLKIAKNQADRLTRLVEDILTVSRIQSGRLKNVPQRLDLAEVIDLVLESLSQKYEARRMHMHLPNGLPEVWADQDRLEQILTNLIDNALKYSEKDTCVDIYAKLDPEDESVLWISVRDQGIGIPEVHLDQLFNRFSRIDSPLTREREGTGLGLYITKSLVESLGGTILVESQFGHGSIFTVCLPAAQHLPMHLEEGLHA
ncbi:MAG: PAS domain-containing protein [Anaerolineae bacterium]|nr:PAS domain-containing protein [Gloeobacterales cyanobacterium ES-bin-313]